MRLPKGIEYSTEPEDLLCYGFDASGLKGGAKAVAWPESAAEVALVVNYANQNHIAITPRGAGTGMTGGAVPSDKAVVLSTERLNRLLEIDTDNLNAVVEPGLINGALQRELKPHGLFYPPDPASMEFCTLGGNVAENAGGPRAVKYGVTRDYVMELEAVLPDGSIIHTGKQTVKGVVGYDLTSLLVGSEGTLAFITKMRLAVRPKPQSIVTMLGVFDEFGVAAKAVAAITRAAIVPRTLEFMDQGAIKAVENYRPCGLPKNAGAVLLIELDGHPASVENEGQKISGILDSLGAQMRLASDQQERTALWTGRRALSPALFHLCPGKTSEDIVVPRSRLPEALSGLSEISRRTGVEIVNFGHFGDGNIHVNLMADRFDTEEARRALQAVKEIFKLTVSLGGTISGEHGVGLTKSPYMGLEVQSGVIDIMKNIKGVFDPKGIMNPGKIFTANE